MTERRSSPPWIAIALAVVAAALVPYWTVLGHGFVFDDVHNIVENPWIRDASFLPEVWTSHAAGHDPQFSTSYYRPVMHLAYMATYAIAGLDPTAFHAVNLALHVVASLLVALCFRSLLRRFDALDAPAAWGALVAGCLFAAHPVHVEAVAWLAGITDLTLTVFALAGLATFLSDSPGVRVTGAACWLLLALLSKEPAAVLPLVFLALEWMSRPKEVLRVVRALWPVGVSVAAYLALRWNALGGFAPVDNRAGVDPVTAILSAIELFGSYVRYLVVPCPLQALHPFEPPTSLWDGGLLASVAILATLLVAWRSLRGRPVPRAALLVVALPLLPVLWIPALGEGAFAERYLYFPSVGFAWLGGWGVATALRRATRARAGLVIACGAVLLIASGVGTARRVPVWRDALSLWTDTATKAPTSAAAREYLCYALYEVRRFDEAAAECREALRLEPDRVDARVNLGNALAMMGDLDGAVAALDEALRRRPTSVEAWTTRGLVRMAQGATDDALASYRRALEIDPGSAEAHNVLGVACARLGRAEEARREIREAVRLAPEREEYRRNLESLGGPR